MRLGLDCLKFFPAEANGGVNALKAISGPYGKLTFMPTGGVNESNLELLGLEVTKRDQGGVEAPAIAKIATIKEKYYCHHIMTIILSLRVSILFED